MAVAASSSSNWLILCAYLEEYSVYHKPVNSTKVNVVAVSNEFGNMSSSAHLCMYFTAGMNDTKGSVVKQCPNLAEPVIC